MGSFLIGLEQVMWLSPDWLGPLGSPCAQPIRGQSHDLFSANQKAPHSDSTDVFLKNSDTI